MAARRAGPAPADRLGDAYRGALVGTAIGDGLGAPFEGRLGPIPLDDIAEMEAASTSLHHTDDTAMTLALAESLLAIGDLDEDHLAVTFAQHWQRAPHRGYGAGTATLLQRIANGAAWRPAAAAQFDGQGSHGNGAAMRVAPIALIAGDVETAAALARRSAVVTHTHPLALDGAALQAAAVAAALDQDPHRSLDPQAFLADVRPVVAEPQMHDQLHRVADLVARGAAPEDVAGRLGTGVAAVEAVPAALCTFLIHHGSFTETVRFSISLGGDTDTIAAMAAAISGARLGASSIPPSWIRRAEGASELQELADRLAEGRRERR